MYQVSGGAGGYSEGLKSERVGEGVGESGQRCANWATPPPAVTAGLLSAGFSVCSLECSLAHCMNRRVIRLENRRRRPGLRPDTTEKVSIHLITITFQSSATAAIPKSPWFWHLGVPGRSGYIFTACWFTFTHDYSSRRGSMSLSLGGNFLLLLAPPGCTVWCYIQAALSTAYIWGSGVICLAPTLCCALYICYLTESSLRPFRESIITPFHRLENLGSQKRSKLPKITELVIGEAGNWGRFI